MAEQEARIARIDEKVINLTDAFKGHEKQDEERFTRTFNFMKERFDKIDDKLETLWDDNNKNKGALAVSKLVAGALGGIIVFVAQFITNSAKGQ